MIKAMIFDLDGTLVQTERLKAQSYAQAAVELCQIDIIEKDVVEAFKEVVGLSREEVASSLVNRFNLTQKAQDMMAEFEVDKPWQAYVQLRLQIYSKMLDDSEVIRKNQWPHSISLLQEARRTNCKVGLTTMSFSTQVRRVLKILELTDVFDFVASRDDVEKGKPDPEINLLVAKELGISPSECLVIEHSPAGVQAGLNAGMKVVAVSTPFTHTQLHQSGLLTADYIVDDPKRLQSVVAKLVEKFNQGG